MIIRTIINLLKKLIAWIAKNPGKAIGVGVGAGTVVGVAGAGAAYDAKKINKRAQAIQQEALALHAAEYEKVQHTLLLLGNTKKEVIDSLPAFADAMEKIQGRPKMKSNMFSAVKLRSYEPEELRCLANGVQLAIVGVGGACVGALVGLAAFGAGAIIAAPASIVGGAVICVKGFSLRKKAIENVRQAKQMRKSVNEIVKYYVKLHEVSDTFRDSIAAVYSTFRKCLDHVNKTIDEKTTWKSFSREEKRNTKNTIMLARLLYEMCNTNVVVKVDAEKEDALEAVNEAALIKLGNQAKKLLGDN